MATLIKNLLFTLMVPGTAAVCVPLLIADGSSVTWPPGRVIAFVLFTAGGAVYIWCIWDFAAFGRGTPAPIDAPKRLVVRGLYRFTRNPMYLGVLTVVVGWAVLFRSLGVLVYAVGVATCFHLFVVLYEEPHLQREFGQEYEEYRSRVPRWLPNVGLRETS